MVEDIKKLLIASSNLGDTLSIEKSFLCLSGIEFIVVPSTSDSGIIFRKFGNSLSRNILDGPK